MNTIEQAQEVAKRLRSLMGSWPLPQEAADTICALIAALSDERMRCAQADNAVAQMAAELAALKGQEPVAPVEIKHMVGVRFHATCEYGCNLEDGAPLFLAADAQQNIIWNRKIRDSVDSLLDQAGYAKDSSARHQLSLMNFDAASAQPYDQQALEPCEACGWKAIIPGEQCLVCERDALKADAERYRWLREQCQPCNNLTIATASSFGLEPWSGDDPDSEIDAAMKGKS